VVCIHGHGPFGHDVIVGRTDQPGMEKSIAAANYDYGLQFVRRGYVVAAPCLIPFGRRVERDRYGGNDPCAVTFVRMQALGQLPITANLRDLKWTIDWLQSLPEVDGRRIGCAGLSYGGRMSMMLAAFDDRIKVAAVSGALNLMQERMSQRHSCGSQMIPGLLNIGDYAEIGSLIAPRPCVWETGSTDKLIVPEWDEAFRTRLRRAYSALGVEDHLHFDRFEGGHVWSGRIAFPLFDEVLKPGQIKDSP
jgi:dienelactone hydrolase